MVRFKATHVVKVKGEPPVEVMLDGLVNGDGPAYTREEWKAWAPADFERDGGFWHRNGQVFVGSVERIRRKRP